MCVCVKNKPARLIIKLLFGFVSDSVFVKINQNKTNTETALLSMYVLIGIIECKSTGPYKYILLLHI